MRPSASRQRVVASALGTVGIALWATETVLITFTTALPPLQTVALAFGFAALLSPLAWALTGDDPRAAFRQPPRVWILTVGSLVGYHASIYYATQNAPPAAAALLQGTTPLIIVLGSALLPGERLRWWHVVGAALGFAGVLLLIDGGSGDAAAAGGGGAIFYLGVVGAAAALWGGYSIVSRSFGEVPSSALGVFYAASAALSLALHASFETWVAPTGGEWLAVAALGVLPMGLALYLWDHGVKRGDIQALGAISYVEPFIGAALVALVGRGELSPSLVAAGALVVAGAATASRGLFLRAEPPAAAEAPPPAQERTGGESEAELELRLLDVSIRLLHVVRANVAAPPGERAQRQALETDRLLAIAVDAWKLLDAGRDADAERAGAADPPVAACRRRA
jgi:drug/metabolite transporter (DMT)-like permease